MCTPSYECICRSHRLRRRRRWHRRRCQCRIIFTFFSHSMYLRASKYQSCARVCNDCNVRAMKKVNSNESSTSVYNKKHIYSGKKNSHDYSKYCIIFTHSGAHPAHKRTHTHTSTIHNHHGVWNISFGGFGEAQEQKSLRKETQRHTECPHFNSIRDTRIERIWGEKRRRKKETKDEEKYINCSKRSSAKRRA